jgi:hypothetical protein
VPNTARRIYEPLQVRSNLVLTLRERGKKVTQVVGHNIWLNLGREFIVQLISYSAFGPDTAYRNDRIKFMGVGIGGNKQIAPAIANNTPISTAYPGTNTYVDTDATITSLERPVRVTGGSSGPPYSNPSDVWLGRIQAPPTFPSATEVTYRRVFSQAEISYSPFDVVPLSEIGLFTSAANPSIYNNSPVAYDTFPTIAVTTAFDLEVAWTIRA